MPLYWKCFVYPLTLRQGDWFRLCLVNKCVPMILSDAYGFCRLTRRPSLTALLGSEMELVQITKQIGGDRAQKGRGHLTDMPNCNFKLIATCY
jgi:hypothetical protein